MRSRLLSIALTLLICSEAAALAQCDDKSQQMLPTKPASRVTWVRHPSARRRLIRRGRRKSSKTPLRRQKAALALMGGPRQALPPVIVKRTDSHPHRMPDRVRKYRPFVCRALEIRARFELRPSVTTRRAARQSPTAFVDVASSRLAQSCHERCATVPPTSTVAEPVVIMCRRSPRQIRTRWRWQRCRNRRSENSLPVRLTANQRVDQSQS
jgi:hypothetical protein